MYIKVTVAGVPARLLLEGSDFILSPRGGSQTKLAPEKVKEILDNTLASQMDRLKDIMSTTGSIWVLQPALKDASMEMERLASLYDEVNLALRAAKVRLAPPTPPANVKVAAISQPVVKREPVKLPVAPPVEEPIRRPAPPKRKAGVLLG